MLKKSERSNLFQTGQEISQRMGESTWSEYFREHPEDQEPYRLARTAISHIEDLVAARGVRYRNCRFRNYKCDSAEQTKVKEQLEHYCHEIEANLHEGNGLVLFGPKGTGKDHLLMSVAYSAISAGSDAIKWCNGLELYAGIRDAISNKHTESSVKDPLVIAPVLWISDPLPPTGALTEHQQAILFEIIDRRYSNARPTWVSVNVASGSEAESRLGAATVDRLRDGAMTLFCNWESYRKPRQ